MVHICNYNILRWAIPDFVTMGVKASKPRNFSSKDGSAAGTRFFTYPCDFQGSSDEFLPDL